jgi:hypothetical protein
MPEAFRLPPGWGDARLVAPGAGMLTPCAAAAPAGAGALPRSYDHLGATLEWSPGPACGGALALACDLEHAERFAGAADPAVADGRLSLESWVATEVLAKLTDTPVLAFLRAHGCFEPGAVGAHEVPLEAWGARGRARLWLVTSEDGMRFAGFGMRLDA